jgi:hypothetical protein
VVAAGVEGEIMKKCIWVIERRYEEGWSPLSRQTYSTREVARSHMEYLYIEFDILNGDLRTRKYVRAEK